MSIASVPINNQGNIIVEPDDDEGLLIMYPTGDVVTAVDRDTAERKIRAWCKRNQDPAAVSFATVEWRD